METIYLIGFMGAGKTTISRQLAQKLSLTVYDTDKEIVKASGKSINEIFAADGEARFRQMESDVLRAMPAEDAVVATGGGIVVSEENRDYFMDKTNTVFLYTDFSEVMKRLEGDETRPLLHKDKLAAAESLYKSRLPLYRMIANMEIDTSPKSISMIVDEIIERMK